ncbi:hypothetical protein STANM309S_06283 [Streptomyces tanashiensis]
MVYLKDTEGEQAVGVDGTFSLLALGFGVVSALAVFLVRRRGGVPLVVALAVGACWRRCWPGGSAWLGPAQDVVARGESAGKGVTFDAPLKLNAKGALLAWPFAALVVPPGADRPVRPATRTTSRRQGPISCRRDRTGRRGLPVGPLVRGHAGLAGPAPAPTLGFARAGGTSTAASSSAGRASPCGLLLGDRHGTGPRSPIRPDPNGRPWRRPRKLQQASATAQYAAGGRRATPAHPWFARPFLVRHLRVRVLFGMAFLVRPRKEVPSRGLRHVRWGQGRRGQRGQVVGGELDLQAAASQDAACRAGRPTSSRTVGGLLRWPSGEMPPRT